MKSRSPPAPGNKKAKQQRSHTMDPGRYGGYGGGMGGSRDVQPSPPSRVLHMRNVGDDVVEEDLKKVGREFGDVERVVMLKNKRQAMMQFCTLQSAAAFMARYGSSALRIRGRSVYPSYSRHQELSPDAPNRILLVTFANARHAELGDQLLLTITIDLVYQLFAPFGPVVKIVLINKDAGVQALVQYASPQSAEIAKQQLTGYTFFTTIEALGSFTLDVQYSNLQDLIVKQQSARARDFTQVAVAITPQYMAIAASMIQQQQQAQQHAQQQAQVQLQLQQQVTAHPPSLPTMSQKPSVVTAASSSSAPRPPSPSSSLVRNGEPTIKEEEDQREQSPQGTAAYGKRTAAEMRMEEMDAAARALQQKGVEKDQDEQNRRTRRKSEAAPLEDKDVPEDDAT